MNSIIKKIEDEQMKAEVPVFNVGDTVEYLLRLKKKS